MTTFKHSLITFTSTLLLMGSISFPAAAEELDEVIDIDNDGSLEYIEIDEIIDDEDIDPVEVASEPTSQPEIPQEEEEFVDLNQILYGGEDPDSADSVAENKDPETLQQEMQTLKEKILQVNRDLFILEEDLLFPSSTQVNVFVSYDALEYFQLDGVSLKINNSPISNHLYTEREISAMNRGAVQRLFTGNLPVGEHELVAVVTGVGPGGRDYKRAVSLDFEKSSGTKYIELKIEGDDLRKQPGFRLKQWD